MDRLKRSRSANKRVFNNYKLQIDNELAEETPSIVNLKTLMELLASKWQTISQICQDIQDLIPCDDENEAFLEQELEEESVLQSEFVRVRILVDQKLSFLETTLLATASTSHPGVNVQSSLPHIPRLDVRLPKLELKHFGGNTFEWSSFWDCFNSTIHSKTNLEPVNKFSYLKSVLVEKAATAISGLELTDANYAVAINILKDRFGRKEVIINAHMNKLLSLPSVQKLSDVKALRRLYDDSEVTVRGLEALGVASGTYSSLLCPVLISKIPEKLAVDWHKRPTSSTDGIDDLIDFLKQEVDSRERSQMMRAGPSNSSHQSDLSRSRQDNKGNKSKMNPSASALMSSSQQSHQSQQSNPSFKRRISCIYCDSTDHYPISCKVPREEKVKTLHNKKCCLLCLRTGHGVKECQHPRQKCCYCQKRHHPSICETPASSQTNSEKNDGGKSSNSTSVLAAGVSSDGVVFLQTASVTVSGLKVQKKIICLLDGGEPQKFHSEKSGRSPSS